MVRKIEEYIDYIRSVIEKDEGILADMALFAKKNKVPIVKPEVARFLSVITRMVNAERILEIGTAIGYSSLILSEGLKENGRLDTIEREDSMFELATDNINKAGKSNVINLIKGEAVEVLSCLNTKYQLIFMDCAKGQYIEFLPYVLNLLDDNGVLVTDNILFRGMVVNKANVIRRKKTIVTRLDKYIEEICNSKQLKTSILPIGDGVSISYKL